MRTIAFVNQKGGVGKTTSCLNMGAALALLGNRVLLVDFDPQGSLSKCLGVRDLEDKDTSFEVLTGKADIKEARIKLGKYDLLPLDIRMAGHDHEFTGKPFMFSQALDPIRSEYDYCLIDCSPALDYYTILALTAADRAIIPIAPEYMPLDGLIQVTDTVVYVFTTIKNEFDYASLLITLFDSRRNLDKDVEKYLRDHFSTTFKTVIKRTIKLAEARLYCQDIFEYDPKGPGAAAYMELTKEFLKSEERRGMQNETE